MTASLPRHGEAARADRVSYWMDSARRAERASGSLPWGADVVVVGTGIVGLTCALRLAEAGRQVVVLEADGVAAGVSGYTTAKLTAGHGLLLSHLEDAFGRDEAAMYARAQLAALEHVRELVEARGIECDLEAQPNYVFAESDEERDQIAAETKAARRAGLEAEQVDLDGPFPAGAAVMLPDQAQFHPRKYLLALADLVEAASGHVATGQRVVEITGTGPLEVRTESGRVEAPAVVVATHYPIVEQGFFVSRIHPRRSYVVAAPLEEPVEPGMYINVGTPTRSLRTTLLEDGRRLLLVGGEGHRVGQGEAGARPYETLERYMRAHFRVGETAYRWSTQDNHTVDRLPYVGRVGDAPGLFAATGFAGWGMTNGTVAGLTIAGAILGEEAPWTGLFALDRGTLRTAARRLLGESLNVAVEQLGGPFRSADHATGELERGQGAVLSIEGDDVAVSRDSTGTLHAVSPRCTHMGCVVSWNEAESSWDCPCHGSRFAATGEVLHGPALKPLEPVELDPREDDGA